MAASPQTSLARFRQELRTEDHQTLRESCASLFADRVDHREIVRLILERATDFSVADPSWLPAATALNLSESLVHVRLQKPEDKHLMVAFGEGEPAFRRMENPPPATEKGAALKNRFEEAAVGNDWQLAERCLLALADQEGVGAVFSEVLECLLQPRYLGATSGPWWSGVRHLTIGGAIDLWQEFGDEAVRNLICYLGAKQCTKTRRGHGASHGLP